MGFTNMPARPLRKDLGLSQTIAVSRAAAAAAVATAELEITRRGLVTAVTSLFTRRWLPTARLTWRAAPRTKPPALPILPSSGKDAREAAHADVVKAQLQQQQRERDLAEALLGTEVAAGPGSAALSRSPHGLHAHVAPDAPLPARADVDEAAMRLNPELRQALASLRVSTLEVTAARAAYLPDLALNFTYGIDAAQFAVNGRDGPRNLGYSASATLDIPVWDWLSTQHRVRQSEILRERPAPRLPRRSAG